MKNVELYIDERMIGEWLIEIPVLDIEGYKFEFQSTNEYQDIYYCSELENTIVFKSWDEEVADMESIINFTTSERFDQLIDLLVTENGIAVLWSQVEGTTSDWLVFYDIDTTELDSEINEDLTEVLGQYVKDFEGKGFGGHKCGFIRDGVISFANLTVQ